MNNDGNIEFIPKKTRGKPSPPKLDLHLSSSTIKSLFGIWFYLEYQAQVNDTIMLDEPELNLHPSNQRVIARIVTKLVNAGINVILSTHSDYFVREINSLVMLSDEQGDPSTKSELMTKYSISEDCVINKDKIGAYLFKDNNVKPMEITNEGIIATTFDEEINLLNESSDDIYYSYVEPIGADDKITD
ncbi:AAA family ATPase [Neisseria mucosa]|uniref:AAA family ATPase n=1 Tax=Neisseria mucosa TaxID=488 RepID=UPI0018E097C5|nr:AAA family ATPase [Neisseria mucosa]